MAARFEADGIDRGVDFGNTEDLFDLVLRRALGDVDGFASERSGLLELHHVRLR